MAERIYEPRPLPSGDFKVFLAEELEEIADGLNDIISRLEALQARVDTLEGA